MSILKLYGTFMDYDEVKYCSFTLRVRNINYESKEISCLLADSDNEAPFIDWLISWENDSKNVCLTKLFFYGVLLEDNGEIVKFFTKCYPKDVNVQDFFLSCDELGLDITIGYDKCLK